MRRFVATALAVLCTLASASPAIADLFPERTVRLIVPFVAGGTVDVAGRIVAHELSEAWKQPVIVENRLGAGGNIATEFVGKSAPDGYTLLLTTAAIAIAPNVYKGLPFDPAKDFVPVSKIGVSPALLIVNPRLEVNSVSELIDLAKARPGKLNYGSSGAGASVHLATELFKSKAQINLVHVPYKGSPPAYIDLVRGEIHVMIDSLRGTLPLAKSGKVKALAVSTANRSPLAPEFPTIAESGVPGYDFSFWYTVFVHSATPARLTERLNRDINAVLQKPSVVKQLVAQGVVATPSTLTELVREYRNELRIWAEVAKGAGIVPQ